MNIKQLLRLGVVFGLGVTASCPAPAQTAKETWQWIDSFISQKGGDVNEHEVETDSVSKGRVVLYYSDMKKIELWKRGDERNSYVRLAGKAHDCTDVSGVGGEEFIKTCPALNTTMDIYLKEDRENGRVNSQRLIKAFTHLAELAGAKVNEAELF